MSGSAPPSWGMDGKGFSGDEVWGVFALGALRAGDATGAVAALGRARLRYAGGFLARLAMVAPGASIRLMWLLAVKRLARSGAGRGTYGEADGA